jgi:hypothetical protein
MKTKNSIKIKAMKSSALALVVTFAVITAGSQESLKASNDVTISTPLLAATGMITEPNKGRIPNGLPYWNGYLSEESEAALEVENWMINESHFNSPYNIEVAMEEPLAIENWMINENLFYSTIAIEVEKEEAIEVQDWMLNSKLYESRNKKTEKNETVNMQKDSKARVKNCHTKRFETRTLFLIEVKDPELKVEQWMLDYKVWNRK